MEEISVHEILTFYNMFNKEGLVSLKYLYANLPCALRRFSYTVEFLKELLGLKLEEQLRRAIHLIGRRMLWGLC